MRKELLGLIFAGLLTLFGSLASLALEPVPLLDFDFGKIRSGEIKDQAESGLLLTLGKSASPKDGALVFNGSDDSFASADEAKYKEWKKKLNMREIAGAFWIRFDKSAKNARTASLGLFNCALDKDGRLELELFTQPTEIMSDKLVLRSKSKLEYGKWYHVEFNYSFNKRRYSLYLDGKWQMENDNLTLPLLSLGKFKLGDGFYGAIRDLKFYDVALDSESLAIANEPASYYDALKQEANAICASTKNETLKAWADSLAKKAALLQANIGKTTVAQIKNLKRDINNAKTLADGIADDKNTIANQPVTSYTVPATTQALFLPYDLPSVGKLSKKIELFAAQGEFESASLVVVPFKPMKSFTIKVSDLKNGANVIPSSNLDPKLVKRLFHTGGAWMSYHADKRQRVLTPNLLINDDKIIRVDEIRTTNELLLHFPHGDKYVDVSQYAYDQSNFDKVNDPFYDAPSLQPLELPEAGRNQQYYLTFHVPEKAAPGFYDGKVELIADGQPAGEIAISLRVLPFELPDAKTYYDINRTYYSHINSAPTESKELFFKGVKNLKEHSLLHASRISDTPWQIELAKKAGYPLKELVSAGSPKPSFWAKNFGGPLEKISVEDEKILDKMFLKDLKKQTDFYTKYIGPDVIFYCCGTSEAGSYGAIVVDQERGTDLYHQFSNGRLMTHGMSDSLHKFTSDFNDMDSATRISREWADIWHAAGGRTINYCDPFPGAENPAWFRRKIGLLMYKDRYDGQMLHGYLGTYSFWNEFAEWPGGDGNYRNFMMAYPQQNGLINKLAIEGAREAYDDVRYATKLQQLALAYRDSKDIRLAREAKRQLVWLERIDGQKADMDAFRTGAAHRILTLMELAKVREGNK